MSDHDDFPDPVYNWTVLAPLFDGVKVHYAAHMDAINRAHLVMLKETGILTRPQSTQIATALETIASETDVERLRYTGEHEDYFFLVEHQLKEALGPDLGGMLHTARSRNDMDHTMFKMALRDRADTLLSQAFGLARTLLVKAEAERDTLIVAYTHGQPAQASTFGHYLSAALEVLTRDIERLLAARDSLDLCPMGAAAITTTGFPIDRTRMAELLGFRQPMLNSYGCIASVDYITGLYSAIRLMFIHLGRVVQDFQFWTAFEVGQMHVPDSLVQISSIMPQKRNPVPIEHMRHLASMAAGRADAMITTMHNTPFTDMNDSEGEVQQAGYAAFSSGGRMLELMSAFIAAVSINPDRVRQNADRACVTVTELADILVRVDGLSFRQAHDIAARTARAVIATGRPLADGFPVFRQAFAKVAGRDPALDEPAYAEAVSLRAFVNTRKRLGGPAPEALDAAFAMYHHTLAALHNRLESKRGRIDEAREELASAFKNCLVE